MQTITVYDHGRAGFRVAIGEHKQHKGSKSATVRVYEDAELQSAATLAYSLEQRADIRAQIQRAVPELSTTARLTISKQPTTVQPTEIADERTDAMRALTAAIGEAPEHSLECATCGQHFNERSFYSTSHSSMCADPQEV